MEVSLNFKSLAQTFCVTIAKSLPSHKNCPTNITYPDMTYLYKVFLMALLIAVDDIIGFLQQIFTNTTRAFPNKKKTLVDVITV